MFVSDLRQRVKLLLEEGLSPAAIARELGVAGPTVDYHVSRLRESRDDSAARGEPAPRARSQVTTGSAVAALLREGLSRTEIAKRLGLSKATISYHARRLGAPVDSRCARRYDWDLVQEYYDRGHSVRECCAAFGFSRQTWQAAATRGVVTARPAKMPSHEFFVRGVPRSRMHLKRRLLAEGWKEPLCATCGISDWRDRPLSLAVHHINGDRLDNRAINLELLCPNCHSQTPNFSGRKRRVRTGAGRVRRVRVGRLSAVAAGIAVALTLAGCGEDNDESGSTGTTGTGTGTQAEQPAPSGRASETVELRETEFAIEPAEALVEKPGVVELRVKNDGQVTHALEVESEDLEEETEDIAAGDSATLKVELTEGTNEL